jgi:uncharacterized protein YdhG (YjbR/CyaY superfamily)
MNAVPPPDAIAEYLDTVPPAAVDGLLDLRAQILALLPQAQERISYQIPVFVIGGQVVGMGATATAISLYSMSPPLMARIGPRLRELGVRVKGATAAVPHGSTFPPEAVGLIVAGRTAELGID